MSGALGKAGGTLFDCGYRFKILLSVVSFPRLCSLSLPLTAPPTAASYAESGGALPS